MGRWRAQGSNGDAEPHAGRGLLPPRRARGSGGDTTELPSEARKGFRGRERGMQPGRGGARGAWLPPHREGQSGAGTHASPHGRGRAASLQGERRMPTSPPVASPGAHPRPAHSGAQRILAGWERDEHSHASFHGSSQVCFSQTEGKTSTSKRIGTRFPAVVCAEPVPPRGRPRGCRLCGSSPCHALLLPGFTFFFLSFNNTTKGEGASLRQMVAGIFQETFRGHINAF